MFLKEELELEELDILAENEVSSKLPFGFSSLLQQESSKVPQGAKPFFKFCPKI